MVLLSVIIPTRNRSRRVADLLDSLARQESAPFEWEVIVVDNASTDDTAAVVQQKSQTLSIRIWYVLETRPGLHQGRHRGAREAQGDYVGYLDDDMLLEPTWIHGVQRVVQGQADAVVGRILPKWEAEPPEWLLAMAPNGIFTYLGLLDLGDIAKPVDSGMVFGGNCFLPRKSVFNLGGFCPDGMPAELLRYRGDGENGLMKRFKQAGLNAYYEPRATAYHVISADRLTVEYLCKRAYNEGISNSFTQIRAEYWGEQPPRDRKGLRYYVQRAREMSLSELMKAGVRRFERLVNFHPYPEIQKQIDAAYQAGWQFHQDAIKSDPELFKHVVRENYFEEDMDIEKQEAGI
jgi:glycosyltransferase involved in cell wall biosynthesis